jgi:UDP-N-acetylmuramyl pentapeptide phosphotransferase/UDP-N-acetylglucosamine-1-phosphate transferase
MLQLETAVIPAIDMWAALAVPAATSFIISLMIVLTEGWHGRYTFDIDMAAIQKMHRKPVPRIGGIALCSGIAAVVLFGFLGNPHPALRSHSRDLLLLLVAGMPCFLMGLTEDLTKRVSVRARLMATFGSALTGAWLLGAYLPRLDIYGVDQLLQYGPLALVITAIAVAGVSNAINIIDGFNGVAGSAVTIMLAGMGVLAWQVGDMFVLTLVLAGIGAMLGFLAVNYPTGRLFMGDGGAYVSGFWVAEIAVLIIIRQPGISPWQVLAICAYPVIEVLYTVYRRKIIRKCSPSAPDRLHLHTLLYRRLVRRWLPASSQPRWKGNSVVACIVTLWLCLASFAAITLGKLPWMAFNLVALQILLYMAIYARLVRGHWCLNPVVMLGLRAESRTKLV